LAKGGSNTEFFHNYDNHRKHVNTIWDIGLTDGSMAKSFKEIAKAGKNDFKNISKEPKNTNIRHLLKVVRLFPRVFNQRINGHLEALVTQEELNFVLHSSKKEKCPCLNGWTKEFYLGFYDFLE
jgi:hypothetical protein